MLTRAFYLSSVLRSIADTEQFREYCRARGIALDPTSPRRAADWWPAAVSSLPPDQQTRVEWELAEVSELSGPDETAHLVKAAGDRLPPEAVPAGAPLALWCLLHRPEVFRDVLLHHDAREDYCWRRAKAAAGIRVDGLPGRMPALAAALRTAYGRAAGGGRFCAADAEPRPDGVCVVARVSDRPRLLEEFTADGEEVVRCVRPTSILYFLYTPRDGAVWLKSPVRAADSVRDLFRCFGDAVLGSPVACGGPLFDLDRLKHPFHPLPDAEDMELVRVRALHLRYPARRGRRRVVLSTLPGDHPGAVEEMLGTHVADLAGLRVSHAELQVRVRAGGRVRDYPIRLWPDRYSLARTPLGERLFQCLRRWELCHG